MENIKPVAQCVRDAIAFALGVEPAAVTDEATIASLGGDSLEGVECVMAVEDALGIEVTDTDADKLYAQPVREWVLYCEARRGAAS